MSNNIAEYAVGWLFVTYKMLRKWQIYLKQFFTDSPTRHTHTYTHTHTPTIAIGENEIRCISPKNVIALAHS